MHSMTTRLLSVALLLPLGCASHQALLRNVPGAPTQVVVPGTVIHLRRTSR